MNFFVLLAILLLNVISFQNNAFTLAEKSQEKVTPKKISKGRKGIQRSLALNRSPEKKKKVNSSSENCPSSEKGSLTSSPKEVTQENQQSKGNFLENFFLKTADSNHSEEMSQAKEEPKRSKNPLKTFFIKEKPTVEN